MIRVHLISNLKYRMPVETNNNDGKNPTLPSPKKTLTKMFDKMSITEIGRRVRGGGRLGGEIVK